MWWYVAVIYLIIINCSIFHWDLSFALEYGRDSYVFGTVDVFFTTKLSSKNKFSNINLAAVLIGP